MISLKTVTDAELVFDQRLKPQAQDGVLWPRLYRRSEKKASVFSFVSISFLFNGIVSLGGPAFFFPSEKKILHQLFVLLFCHRYCPQI